MGSVTNLLEGGGLKLVMDAVFLATKAEELSPPFICCAQGTMGLFFIGDFVSSFLIRHELCFRIVVFLEIFILW